MAAPLWFQRFVGVRAGAAREGSRFIPDHYPSNFDLFIII
jgi:hypothetical protein